MVISRDQNAGRNHIIQIDNNSFENVKDFTYLVTNVTDKNCIQEGIKSRLKSGNAC